MALSFLKSPIATQENVLRYLLHRARKTEWGRQFGFNKLRKESDLVGTYPDAVPFHTYEDYESDIRRIQRGEKDIIWPGQFSNFAVSSGTVSDGNIIPVSEEMLRKNRAFSYGVMRSYIRGTGDFRVLFGKTLSVPGRVEHNRSQKKALVGEVSGLLAASTPGALRGIVNAVPTCIQNMENWEQKLDAIVEKSINRDVRSIVMVPSWAIVLFNKLIQRYNRDYSRSAATVHEIWPNLSVFFSGGVALSVYRSLLERLVGGEISFVESYGASEGFFSFQDRRDAHDMLLHLDNGVYYEFVRMDDNSSTPVRHSLKTVETGIGYRVLVSTCSGLWAYGVRDVIEFTSLSPHRIVITGRTSEVLDTYGEALYGKEAASAIQFACSQTGAMIHGYHIAPVDIGPNQTPRHQWFIEFDGAPPDPIRFSQLLDEHIQSINRHYLIRREAQAFLAPEVTSLPEGAFYSWLKKSRGEVSAQSKVPRMSTDREIADQLLSILRNNTFSSRDAGSN